MTTMPAADDSAATRRRRPKKDADLAIESGSAHVSGETVKRKRRSRRRKRATNNDDDGLPFWKLFLQVGAVVFIVFLLIYGVCRWIWPPSAEDEEEYYVDDVSSQEGENAMDETKAPTKPSLPTFDLGPDCQWDAYAIAQKYQHDDSFWEITRTIRDEFDERYGGQTSARAVLERGLTTFPNQSNKSKSPPKSLQHTACRIKQHQEDFRISFAGYSVTTGRGNYFSQSYPIVMERLLSPVFKEANLGNFSVRNAAIGGVPSFPYGWCLKEFLGDSPNVVSWDYAMNEAGGEVRGIEAYIRHATLLHGRPKLIIKDTPLATGRKRLIQSLVEKGLLVDPIILHSEAALEPFLVVPEEDRPIGFHDWRKFGAPKGAPGQAAHHPGVNEHELMGWLLGMHFLAAIELFVASRSHPGLLECTSTEQSETNLLPPPETVPRNESISILFGKPQGESVDHWVMNKIHCRTTYAPTLSGNLTDILIRGETTEHAMDILMPKGAMFYTHGWVLDLSETERSAKRNLDRFGGLGFLDSKMAFFGIFASGPITFFLPISRPAQVGDAAIKHIRRVVVCQVNEKHHVVGSCNAQTQMSYQVGGVAAPNATYMRSPGTLYLGRKLCVQVEIPAGAIIADYNQQRGVNFTASVNDKHIIKKDKACSIAHVVWEETSPYKRLRD